MSQETLNLINAIASISSAAGTVAAVIVALYLARRDERQRLEIKVDAGGCMSRSHSQYGTVVLVTNIGRRSVRVTGLEWRYKTPEQPIRLFFNGLESEPGNSPLPVKLEDGDVAHYFVDTAEMRMHLDKLDQQSQSLALRSLRFVVSISGGRDRIVKPGALLLKQLRESFTKEEQHNKAM